MGHPFSPKGGPPVYYSREVSTAPIQGTNQGQEQAAQLPLCASQPARRLAEAAPHPGVAPDTPRRPKEAAKRR